MGVFAQVGLGWSFRPHNSPSTDVPDWAILKGMELIFEVRDADEGGFCARALGHPIFTQADTWQELRQHVLEAVSLHFEESSEQPRLVQLHYVKDELIPVEAA